MRVKSKFRSYVRGVVIILFLVIGFSLILNKEIRNLLIAQNSNKYQVTNVDKATLKKNQKANTSFDFSAVDSATSESILANQFDNRKLPVIGGIAIPELNINLPIFKGLGNAELSYGAGTMKEKQVMGGKNNYALASHHVFGINGSSGMLFSPLDNARNGMKIYITDKEKVFTYIVSSIEVVDPDQSEVIQDISDRRTITLVTCYDEAATKRLIVSGTFHKSTLYKEVDGTVRKAFERKYNQMYNN
ncbi:MULTISPECIES: class A sortase [Streptococcus]|uniref:class A sortase n=1 Tax=Streptococcus TaxID=1301 RepID=UPI001E322B2E|nr:sortase [Streptococcus ruminicola]